jgi:hypothetical protein
MFLVWVLLVGGVFSALSEQVWAIPGGYLLPSGPLGSDPNRGTGKKDAAIAVEFHLKMDSKKSAKAKLDMNPMKFVMNVVPGQPVKLIVPVTNISDAPVTIKEITVEDCCAALTTSDSHLGGILLAPAEKYEILLELTTIHGEGKGHVRIVTATAGSRKDEVTYVDVAYSRKRSQDASFNK